MPTIEPNNDAAERGSAFICPECEHGLVLAVGRVIPYGDGTDRWGYTLHRTQCGHCGYVVPTHLGERWGGISFEHARMAWLLYYRKTAPPTVDGGAGEKSTTSL